MQADYDISAAQQTKCVSCLWYFSATQFQTYVPAAYDVFAAQAQMGKLIWYFCSLSSNVIADYDSPGSSSNSNMFADYDISADQMQMC